MRQPIEQRLVEYLRDILAGVLARLPYDSATGLRQKDRRGYHIVGNESQRNITQSQQAAQQQSRGDQQQQ